MRNFHISAPARLHFGFLDLDGGHGRRFGSLGLTLDAPRTTIAFEAAEAAEGLAGEGPDKARALDYARKIIAAHSYRQGGRLRILEAIPPHAGLGSGTQMALTVSLGLALLNGDRADRGAKAGVILGRGERSGIGLAAFERGGLILDGGRHIRKEADSPPVIARLPFPDAWRIILILDPTGEGIHGASERDAFNDLPPYPDSLAGALCRIVLMQALPAVVEADLPGFADAIGKLQRALGDYFACVQNGRFASRHVSQALAWLAEQGVGGCGQTSWGPTGFAFARDEKSAHELIDGLKRQRIGGGKLSFMICRGRNSGHQVTFQERAGDFPS